MYFDLQNTISNNRISAVRIADQDYESPEKVDEIQRAISQNAQNLGWSEPRRGAFGNVISEGQKVVLKPNFVLHKNQGQAGLLPLITHPTVIMATVAEVLKANPEQVVVADAPIQSCDFEELLRQTKLDTWSAELQKKDPRFKGIIDLRRTIATFSGGVRVAREYQRAEDNYILYNLENDSLLEPLTDNNKAFRITNYDPRLMAKTHSPGNHQYLVAREVIEADIVINLPKLKTHKKAGITNALKNLVGINGNKEFLPHHRIGGSDEGGDCYPGSDFLKRTLESVLDQQNMTVSHSRERLLAIMSAQLERLIRFKGDKTGVEGSWSGNETVPRMTLDLNRILLYGKVDASLDKTVQRRVLHLVDAVIAGQGEGPLASEELPLGFIMAGENALVMDWIGALLLGYDTGKIPLIQLALTNFRWPIARLDPFQITLLGDWDGILTVEGLVESAKSKSVVHPVGWRNAKA